MKTHLQERIEAVPNDKFLGKLKTYFFNLNFLILQFSSVQSLSSVQFSRSVVSDNL